MNNETALLEALESAGFVVTADPVEQTPKPIGSKWMRVSTYKIDGESMKNQNIDFYVLDSDGTAFFKDSDPTVVPEA